MEINEQLNSILLNTVEAVTKDIARAQGLTCDFVVSVSPLLEAHYSIKAGYPPTLIVQSQYVLKFVLVSGDSKEITKQKKKFRRDMASALSKIPRMERTLSNNPPAEMIAVLPGSKTWVKTNHPDRLSFVLPDNVVRTTEQYTITMEEINSGMSVTVSGDNPTKLRTLARERLTSLVATNEAMLQKIEQDSHKISEIQPSSLDVLINHNTEVEEIKYNYTHEVEAIEAEIVNLLKKEE